MISPLAFKLAAVYLLPYIYIALKYNDRYAGNIFLTTSYISIDNVVSVSEATTTVENMEFRTKFITNRTCGFLLVDLPPTIGLCPFLSLHAPSLVCNDRDTVLVQSMAAHLNAELIRSSFNVPNFSFSKKDSIAALVRSGTFNYPYLVQSFPSLAVKLRAPVTLVEGNNCGAENCSVPRVTDFFIDGVRDTTTYLAAHYGIKYIYNPYIAPTVNRWLGPPLKYLAEPFRRWYNGALYSADAIGARGFEAGLQVSPENIHLSTISQEIAENLPAYEFSGPTIEPHGTFRSISSSSSVSSGDSLAVFKSPLVSGSSTSLASGSATGVIASSRDAFGTGAIRAASGVGIRYPSMPTLPSMRTSAEVLSTMSRATVDNLVYVPARTILAGQPFTVNVIRSNSRNALATISKFFRRVPKFRRRRQANIISRKLATGIRATGRAFGKLPNWLVHSTFVSVPWVFSGLEHLSTMDVKIQVIHPIQRLASYERYFVAMATLIFCQCFHDQEIRQYVSSTVQENDTMRIGNKEYTQADIVFNVDTGVPGETLRVCSPFFSAQFTGMSKDLLLEMLSVHFDTSYTIEGVLLYNGPAKYIINDYTAYFNDIFPQFSPYTKSTDREQSVRELAKTATYNNDFNRAKRGDGNYSVSVMGARNKRDSYTFTSRDHKLPSFPQAPRILLDSSRPFTMSVQYLLDTPRLRYEFDVLQASHYNTSFSYYKSLRQFAASASLDFNDLSSHSSFRAVGNITLLEIMRGMNPFDLYVPRLNIIRELINGYDMVGDIKKLRAASVKMNVQLEYADIPTLLGLFYLLEFPTDRDGFKKISEKNVATTTMKMIGAALYRAKYARVPMLVISQSEQIQKDLRDMFIVHTRVMEDVTTWALYSPIMLTTSLSIIPSGSYSICISKSRLHSSKYSMFGETNEDLGMDALFADACDLATIHVTFDNYVNEIIENQNMPDRLKSLLSVGRSANYSTPSGGLYDPILSEVINMIEPSHENELDLKIRGRNDEGELNNSPIRRKTAVQPVAATHSGITDGPRTTETATRTNTARDTNRFAETPKNEAFLLVSPIQTVDTPVSFVGVTSSDTPKDTDRSMSQLVRDHTPELIVAAILFMILVLILRLLYRNCQNLETDNRKQHACGDRENVPEDPLLDSRTGVRVERNSPNTMIST